MAPRTAASGPSTSSSSKSRSFPSYLNQSLILPFRNRRQTTNSILSDVPSLSSSPTTSTSTSPTASPPASLPTYFDASAAASATSSNNNNNNHHHNHHNDHDKRQATGEASLSPSSSSPLAEALWGSRSPRRLSRIAPDTLRCSTCSSDVAYSAQIVSKGFTGRYGRAYLVAPPTPSSSFDFSSASSHPVTGRDLMNIRVGKPEARQLVTGMHVVSDIHCVVCSAKLGWKYVDAKEAAQKYKVGKFILETERVSGFRSWEDVDVDLEIGEDLASGRKAGAAASSFSSSSSPSSPTSPTAASEEREQQERRRGKWATDPDEVIFDSEDEDECEDIFAGVWDPVVVAERRSKKLSKKKKRGMA